MKEWTMHFGVPEQYDGWSTIIDTERFGKKEASPRDRVQPRENHKQNEKWQLCGDIEDSRKAFKRASQEEKQP